MRGAEGTPAVQPGSSSDSSWSEGSKNYIRNVEAEGSNPFTSTDKSWSGMVFQRGALRWICRGRGCGLDLTADFAFTSARSFSG